MLFPVSDNNNEIIKMLNTNARSLSPKINSLIDSFTNLELDIAVVTESWLADGEGLDGDLVDLEHGTTSRLHIKIVQLDREAEDEQLEGEWPLFLTD